MRICNIKNPLLPGLFVVLLAAGHWSCADETEKLEPQWKSLTEAVYASGMIVPLNEYKVFSNSDGMLGATFINESDQVKKGDLLFTIRSESRLVQEATQEKLFETIKEKSSIDGPAIKELELRIDLATNKVATDSVNFNRLSRLLEAEAISRSEWEQAKLKYESSQSERLALKKQKENLMLLGTQESRQAESQFKTLRAQNQEGQVRSRMDGVVYEIYKKAGERVSFNEPVALIGETENWIARLTIDERDFSLIKPGQKASIKMDAFPDSVFTATISRILPRLNRAEQSFFAEAVFDGGLPEAIYGLNLEANIIVREREKALTIPKKALFSPDSVWVERNGEKLKVKIRKGIENKDIVEVVEGVDSTDIILIFK